MRIVIAQTIVTKCNSRYNLFLRNRMNTLELKLLTTYRSKKNALSLSLIHALCIFFFFSSRRRHTRFDCDWSSDVCSSDLWKRGLIVTLIIEAVITGILTGGVYALMASGLTLVFGVMDIINVGQGALIILGAYLSYTLEQNLHIDLFLGLLITMPLMFGFGLLIEWLFIRPIKRDRTMLSILVTYGVALIIEGVLNLIFSADYVHLHAWYTTASFQVGEFYLPYIYAFDFLLAMAL